MTTSIGSGAKIKTAVITGAHPYDVVGMQTLFRGISEIDAYPQNLEDFVTDTGSSRETYETLVFYNYHVPTPCNELYPLGGSARDVLSNLGESGQGIFLLHHAILAYPEWQHWQGICGGVGLADSHNRPFTADQNQTVRIRNIAPDHPITCGIADFEIVDETYGANDAGEGSKVLLTTDHARSMKTIAWTRQYKNARVFCYQSGHDSVAFDNPGFQRVVTRGIQWCAGRI